MPKVATVKSPPAGPLGTHPNVLKRNQACHQCRRRKLKCDAKKPCSTCSRSHAHAKSHAAPGVELPDAPDCTYDDVPPITTQPEPAKNRYERLENRINELEHMLKEQTSSPPEVVPNIHPHDINTPSTIDVSSASTSSPDSISNHIIPLTLTSQHLPTDNYSAPSSSTDVYSNGVSLVPVAMAEPTNMTQTSYISSSSNSHYAPGYDMLWSSWPRDLPSYNLLRHLVDVFFAFHPHASRLFHQPSFMASLSLPPTHANFPSVAVLHGICAVGSLYTVAVEQDPSPNLSDMPPDEIFQDKYRTKEHIDSFAEAQVKLAKQVLDEHISTGVHLLETVQAQIIIVWWYWCHARWVSVFMTTGAALRAAVPLGLSSSNPFYSITDTLRVPSLLPPAENVIEDEVRRNTFWLAYAMERQQGCSNGWALSLDDQDITQMMPAKGDQFDLGIMASPTNRQWAHSKDLLLVHPEGQTDSFVLYIKGTMLLAKAKYFNVRYRSKSHLGDPNYSYAPEFAALWEQHTSLAYKQADPRRTRAFIEVDNIAATFRSTFPQHLRNPIPDGVLDPHLYAACLIPHLVIILLHDPHANVGGSGCLSAFKILEAARAILDLIYSVRGSSYDVTLLDFFVTFGWFMSGRVLVRFLAASLQANAEDQILTLRAEIEFIASALAQFGERIPLAQRYFVMLNDFAHANCRGERLLVQGT